MFSDECIQQFFLMKWALIEIESRDYLKGSIDRVII